MDSRTTDGTAAGAAAAQAFVALLILAAGAVTFLFAPFLAMASDACAPGDTGGICSTGRQQFVAHFPRIAVPVVLAAAFTAMFRGKGSPAAGLLALPLFVLVWIVNSVLARS